MIRILHTTFTRLYTLLLENVYSKIAIFFSTFALILRFELLFWHMARYKCRLLTYLLN